MSSFLSDSPISHLLDGYLSGELAEEKELVVSEWLEGEPEWSAAVTRLQQLKFDPALPPLKGDMESDWMRTQVRAQLGKTDSHSASSFPELSRTRPSLSGVFLRRRHIFAALSLGVVLICSGWLMGSSQVPWGGKNDSGVSVYATGSGERATVTLPDGSTVLLNVASRLEVPTTYLRSHRSVNLTGEAMFTVSSHSSKAFTVNTGASTTKVLGTTFRVREYPEDTAATISVHDGKVMVGNVVLTARQMATIGRAGGPDVKSIDAHVPGFSTGVLVLDDISLQAAIPELNRWYDADIRLGDSGLADRRIVGTYEAGSLTLLWN